MDANTTIIKPLSLQEFRKKHKISRDYQKAVYQRLNTLDKFAIWITDRVGTIGFFILILAWTVLWLGWNMLAPKPLQFDPPMGFVLWLFISNVIQLLLMPLIMVGQNVQGKHADARAEHDLQINVKAEEEIEIILQHLEYQNSILIAMLEKQGITLEEALKLQTAKSDASK